MPFIYIAGLIITALWLIWTFNSFIRLNNLVKEAWGDIDVQLKRKSDLIPNLVKVVQGYAKHEQSTIEQVTQARTKALQATSISDKDQADDKLAQNTKSLFAVAENYPTLRANENFLKLQDELTDTENKIESARRFYNGAVRDYNTKIAIFPYNLLAASFHFQPQDFFQLDKDKQDVQVKV